MNWGDKLCGVEITPEAWIGGIVIDRWKKSLYLVCPNRDRKGKLKRHREWLMKGGSTPNGYLPYFNEKPPDGQFYPVFPPKDWAGKTDEELWEEVIGHYPDVSEDERASPFSLSEWKLHELIEFDFFDKLTIVGNDEGSHGVRDVPKMIQALQDAQVLIERFA